VALLFLFQSKLFVDLSSLSSGAFFLSRESTDSLFSFLLVLGVLRPPPPFSHTSSGLPGVSNPPSPFMVRGSISV